MSYFDSVLWYSIEGSKALQLIVNAVDQALAPASSMLVHFLEI